jgi:hypothetical protein
MNRLFLANNNLFQTLKRQSHEKVTYLSTRTKEQNIDKIELLKSMNIQVYVIRHSSSRH